MLQSLLVDLDVPTREKVDDARRNLRVLGPRTDVDIQPRTLLICIWKDLLRKNAVKPNLNAVQYEPMNFNTYM